MGRRCPASVAGVSGVAVVECAETGAAAGAADGAGDGTGTGGGGTVQGDRETGAGGSSCVRVASGASGASGAAGGSGGSAAAGAA